MGDGPDAQAIQQITLSFPSGCYTSGVADAPCGTVDEVAGTAFVRHANGPHGVSAQLTVSGGATSLRASNEVTLTFANPSGFHVLAALPENADGTLASGMDDDGLIWYGGPGTTEFGITAVPVQFGAAVVTSVTVDFLDCDDDTDDEAPFAFEFDCEGEDAETAAAGITPVITSVAGENPGPGGILNADHPFPVRVDYAGPAEPPAFIANPNSRQNGWVNGTVDLAGQWEDPGDDAWLEYGDDDTGIGGYTVGLRMDSSDPETTEAALEAAWSDDPALPDPSLGNDEYCAIASARDDLGNESALPDDDIDCTVPIVASETALDGAADDDRVAIDEDVDTHLRFGVDTTLPEIDFDGGSLDDGDRVAGATLGGNFVLDVQDVGSIGNSGMLSDAAVMGIVAVALPGDDPECVIPVEPDIDDCEPVSIEAAPAFPLVTTTTDWALEAETTPAFYFFSGQAQDAAGNLSDPIFAVVAYDLATNNPSLTTALFDTPLGGGTAEFNANASDNLDLQTIRYQLQYAGGLAASLAYPSTEINDMPDAEAGADAAASAQLVDFVRSNVPVDVTIADFVRQIEDVTANSALAVGGAFKLDELQGIMLDQADVGTAVSPVITAIAAASVEDGVSYTALAAEQLPDSWDITEPGAANEEVSIEDDDDILSVDIEVELAGPTATFNSPFVRVDFYACVDLGDTTGDNCVTDDGGLVLEQIGSVTTHDTVDDGSAFGRVHTYEFEWTPGEESPVTETGWTSGAAGAGVAIDIYAIGVNADGDALVTLVNSNIDLVD